MIDPPDGIGPGEVHEVDAWTIEFADCQAEMFTPEWDQEKRLLHERWTSLDAEMGQGWARNSARWWPEDAKPIVGNDAMIVVNIYVPLKYFDYLANPKDVPSPDEADDIRTLWRQQKSGEKQYESDHFIALIKDARSDEIDQLFADLPDAEHFVGKLNAFFEDHELYERSVLLTNDEDFYLYVVPLERNAQPKERLVDLARQMIALLRSLLLADVDEESLKAATALEKLTFEFGEPPDGDEEHDWDDPGVCALETASDVCISLLDRDELWLDALYEASYGIAASFELRNWLMSSWYKGQPDFSPVYELWKAGGAYRLKGGKCVVYEVERRPG